MADEDIAKLKKRLVSAIAERNRLSASAERHVIRKQFSFASTLKADVARKDKEIAELEAKISEYEP